MCLKILLNIETLSNNNYIILEIIEYDKYIRSQTISEH